MMHSAKPFFILSNPRSGSSLLRVICESNQNISVPPECGYIEWWFEKYKDWNKEDNYSKRLERFCIDLGSSRKFETWNFDILYFKKIVHKYNPEDYADLAALIHITYGLLKEKEVMAWGDKNNYYIHKTSLLQQLYPHAKYIFLIRDGRDVATSYISLKNIQSNSPYFPKLSNDIKEIAEEWNNNNSKVFHFLNAVAKDQVLILRYEDIICSLEKSCRSICEFLNVSFDPGMLKYYYNHLEPKQTLDWKRKTLRSPDKLAIGKYKLMLTEKEIEIFNSVAGSILSQFDYDV
ncbi:sulfotransferase [Antarcticibacterium sp. 1MA-6-2]|uniref:sulfotransferase family protein n=1 Tax=Antarcticibacterium sp. 1MA-6-2 TaxID=2908210 RepID=UPI001F1F305E|nr:sulfotransferase [Antarcticibacterium sp. 1MA-6-2]UJH92521.1 sulfotransferase [Antarcticibacterium sp. 1MA-6-2]